MKPLKMSEFILETEIMYYYIYSIIFNLIDWLVNVVHLIIFIWIHFTYALCKKQSLSCGMLAAKSQKQEPETPTAKQVYSSNHLLFSKSMP